MAGAAVGATAAARLAQCRGEQDREAAKLAWESGFASVTG